MRESKIIREKNFYLVTLIKNGVHCRRESGRRLAGLGHKAFRRQCKPSKLAIPGSNPGGRTKKMIEKWHKQNVQSFWAMRERTLCLKGIFSFL